MPVPRRIYQPVIFGKAAAVLPKSDAGTAASKRLLDKFLPCSLHRYMKDLPDLTPAKRTERAAREERLAKALRDNLHRRKQQQRARDEQKSLQPQKLGRDREPPP
jgi:hypothetical protein